MLLPGSGDAQPADPRVRLLNLCRWAPQDAGLLCVDRAEDLPPAVTELDGGGLEVDLRKRVVWPADPASQTPRALSAACAAAGAAGFDDHHDLGQAGARRARGRARCLRRLLHPLRLPPAGVLVQAWGRGLDRRGPGAVPGVAASGGGGRPQARGQARVPARGPAPVPGLPKQGFDAVWAEVVPADWRQAGPLPRAKRWEGS